MFNSVTEYPLNIYIAFAVIFSILILATFIIFLIRKTNPGKDYTQLKLRINSWWSIICILFLVLIINKTAIILFFAIISFLALKEFFSIVPIRETDSKALFWLYLAIPVQYYWVYIGWYGMFIIFIPIYIFLLLPLLLIITGKTKGFIRSVGTLHWGTMITVFSLSHIAYMVALNEKNNPIGGNAGLILFLIFLTQFNDVSQYIFGKTFGVKKIIPKISPNKTWAGFIGGIITITLLGGLIAPYLTPLKLYEGFLAGAIISISGFFGDIVISAVKRDLNIKDSGNLLPGHGGILDRLDSLTYSAPLFFHFIYYLYY